MNKSRLATVWLAAAIFDSKPAALLISVTAGFFEYGDTLTPKVAAVVPEIADYICNHCYGRQQ